MRVVLFVHSLASDWNHGNAHFLRGVARELVARNIGVRAFEPSNGWSATNLLAEQGPAALTAWREAYPELESERYDLERLDLDEALDGADVVLVHEWNAPELVRQLGRHRRAGGRYLLLFHDTHHRMLSAPEAMADYDLDGYDGVLAFGAVLAEMYRRRGWGRQAFAWHEAADLRVFRPMPEIAPARDLVWIGNWGDEERSAELGEFLIEPVVALGLAARIHGVRYPAKAVELLDAAGCEFGGYLPNIAVPSAFAAARVTVHVPRRPYARLLPGIPTIRVFEALACGIPLVCAPWRDDEGLFSAGTDYLSARNGALMREHLRLLLSDRSAAAAIARNGRARIEARHSCAHRVEELLAICARLKQENPALQPA
jgi:spore maturation protein CgeB